MGPPEEARCDDLDVFSTRRAAACTLSWATMAPPAPISVSHHARQGAQRGRRCCMSASARKTGTASDTRILLCLCALLREAAATVWPDADCCPFHKPVPEHRPVSPSRPRQQSAVAQTPQPLTYQRHPGFASAPPFAHLLADPFSRNVLVATAATNWSYCATAMWNTSPLLRGPEVCC